MEAWKKAGMSFDMGDQSKTVSPLSPLQSSSPSPRGSHPRRRQPQDSLRKTHSAYSLQVTRPALATSVSQSTLPIDLPPIETLFEQDHDDDDDDDDDDNLVKDETVNGTVDTRTTRSFSHREQESKNDRSKKRTVDREHAKDDNENEVVPITAARELLSHMAPVEVSPSRRTLTARSMSLMKLEEVQQSGHQSGTTPVQATLELMAKLKPLQQLSPESDRILTMRSMSLKELPFGTREQSPDPLHPLNDRRSEESDLTDRPSDNHQLGLSPVAPTGVTRTVSSMSSPSSSLSDWYRFPLSEEKTMSSTDESKVPARSHSSTFGYREPFDNRQKPMVKAPPKPPPPSSLKDPPRPLPPLTLEAQPKPPPRSSLKDPPKPPPSPSLKDPPRPTSPQTASADRYRSEKDEIIEQYRKEQGFRDEKRALVAQLIAEKPGSHEPVRLRIPTQPSSSILQKAQSMQNLSDPSSRSQLGPTLSRLLTVDESTPALNVPGAFHAEGRAIGAAPAWASSDTSNGSPRRTVSLGPQVLSPANHSPLSRGNNSNDQMEPLSAYLEEDDDTETNTLDRSISTSMCDASAHTNQALMDGISNNVPIGIGMASGNDEDQEEEDLELSVGLEQAPIGDAEPVSMDLEISRRKRQEFVRMSGLLFLPILLVVAGIGVGVFFALSSLRPNDDNATDDTNDKNQGTGDDQFGTFDEDCLLPSGGLYDCNPSVGLTMSPCISARYDELRSTFLPMVHPNPDEITGCESSNMALVALAASIQRGSRLSGWEVRFYQLANLWFSGWRHAGWLSNNYDPCNWPGISCGLQNNEIFITTIKPTAHLDEKAAIPTEIGLLSRLGKYKASWDVVL